MRKTFLALALSAAFLSTGSAAEAARYNVDPAASKIEIKAVHTGKEFTGHFGAWQAEIDFDAANLAESKIKATLDANSFKTGDKIYDATVVKDDWFNSKAFPEITFESETITAIDAAAGQFDAQGHITMKGLRIPYGFAFTLSDLAQDPVKAHAEFTLDRLALGLGKTADPKAEWVDQDVKMILDITASADK